MLRHIIAALLFFGVRCLVGQVESDRDVAEDISSQLAALQDQYHRLSGWNLNIKGSWSNETSYCNWVGVTCCEPNADENVTYVPMGGALEAGCAAASPCSIISPIEIRQK